MRDVPGSIANAVWSLLALVVVSGAAVLLTWLQHDEVIRAWAQGNSSAQEILATGGIDALRATPNLVPKFIPLAVVSWIVYVALVVVLAAFLIAGHGWSRLVLSATGLFGVLVASLGLNHSLPTSFVIVSGIFIALSVALGFFLWRKDASAHFRVS